MSQSFSRRTLLAGLGAGAAALVGAPLARAAGPVLPDLGSLTHLVSGLRDGLVATDLEVVTVTDTSVTFWWACYQGPHPGIGALAPTVPTDAEVLMAPADSPEPLRQVAYDGAPSGVHLVTVTGLEPGRAYRFACRSQGVTAAPGLVATDLAGAPEHTGVVRTLVPPPGRELFTLALLNDVHIGENKHGLIVGDFPSPIRQVDGATPFPELMLAGALAEARRAGAARLYVNGDTTSEAEPAEVRRFRELMDTYGRYQQDWFVTRGNHDRPHRPAADPTAGYERFPVLAGTADHRDVWGAEFVARQQLWVDRVHGMRVLGIGSAQLDASGGEIVPEQMAAIADELRADPDRPTLALAHHPVTREAAWTNMSGPVFTLNDAQSTVLQGHLAAAPGAFMMAAGHTHRARRTAGDVASGVDFVETGSCGGYPGGYTLLRVFSGGYMLNFHRTGGEDALAWDARSRWAGYGLNPEYTLGTVADRNYVVARDFSGLG